MGMLGDIAAILLVIGILGGITGGMIWLLMRGDEKPAK